MAKHFTKEEIEDIRNQLAITAIHDNELPVVTQISETDYMPFVQDGKNKRILIDDFRSILPEGGPRGYSAYEIAVQHGYEGTEEEWLYDLEHPDGCWMLEGGNSATGNQVVDGNITANRLYVSSRILPAGSYNAVFVGEPSIPMNRIFTRMEYVINGGAWSYNYVQRLAREEGVLSQTGIICLGIPTLPSSLYEIQIASLGDSTMAKTLMVRLSLSFDMTNAVIQTDHITQSGDYRSTWSSGLYEGSEDLDVKIGIKNDKSAYLLVGGTSTAWGDVIVRICNSSGFPQDLTPTYITDWHTISIVSGYGDFANTYSIHEKSR